MPLHVCAVCIHHQRVSSYSTIVHLSVCTQHAILSQSYACRLSLAYKELHDSQRHPIQPVSQPRLQAASIPCSSSPCIHVEQLAEPHAATSLHDRVISPGLKHPTTACPSLGDGITGPHTQSFDDFCRPLPSQTTKPSVVRFHAPSPTKYADHRVKVMREHSCTETDIRFVFLVIDSLHLSG